MDTEADSREQPQRSADGSDGDGGAAAGAAALPASLSTTSHKVASTNVMTAAPPADADEEMGERLTGKRTLQVETPAAGGALRWQVAAAARQPRY